MMGPSHRLLGGLTGVGYAALTGQSFSHVALTGLVATATSNGPTSPDVDRTELWRNLTRALPKGWRRHRGITHWWALPVAAWFAATAADPSTVWVVQALVLGWASHVAGDAIFGKVPAVPGGRYVGLDVADTGGFIETGRARIAGRQVTVLPFGPVRAVMGAALIGLLVVSGAGTLGVDLSDAAGQVTGAAPPP